MNAGAIGLTAGTCLALGGVALSPDSGSAVMDSSFPGACGAILLLSAQGLFSFRSPNLANPGKSGAGCYRGFWRAALLVGGYALFSYLTGRTGFAGGSGKRALYLLFPSYR